MFVIKTIVQIHLCSKLSLNCEMLHNRLKVIVSECTTLADQLE